MGSGCAITVLIGALLVALAAWRVARRGVELRRLVDDGVEVAGRVVEITRFVGKTGGTSSNLYLRYEYVDARGITHRHRSLVSTEFAAAHPEGSPIALVYSRSRPAVSSPRELVERSRAALRRECRIGEDGPKP
jgi:hypothetical protein